MRLTEQVHLKLKQTIQPGDTVIDATAGNGHDTLAMAELVGSSGNVIAVDLQPAAIESTRSRLMAAGQLAQCELIEGDHATVLNQLLPEYADRVTVITFNLGYLPGGAKEIITLPETTFGALEAARPLIRPGGTLLVTAYRGHDGGREEAKAVEAWLRALPELAWQVDSKEPLIAHANRIPPILWIARKQK